MLYKYESYLYSRLYGTDRILYLSDGSYLVDGKEYKGFLRVIADTFSVNSGVSLGINDAIVGPYFQSSALILYGMLFYEISNGLETDTSLELGLNYVDSNDIEHNIPIIYDINTGLSEKTVFTMYDSWIAAPLDSKLYLVNQGPSVVEGPFSFNLTMYYSTN